MRDVSHSYAIGERFLGRRTKSCLGATSRDVLATGRKRTSLRGKHTCERVEHCWLPKVSTIKWGEIKGPISRARQEICDDKVSHRLQCCNAIVKRGKSKEKSTRFRVSLGVGCLLTSTIKTKRGKGLNTRWGKAKKGSMYDL